MHNALKKLKHGTTKAVVTTAVAESEKQSGSASNVNPDAPADSREGLLNVHEKLADTTAQELCLVTKQISKTSTTQNTYLNLSSRLSDRLATCSDNLLDFYEHNPDPVLLTSARKDSKRSKRSRLDSNNANLATLSKGIEVLGQFTQGNLSMQKLLFEAQDRMADKISTFVSEDFSHAKTTKKKYDKSLSELRTKQSKLRSLQAKANTDSGKLKQLENEVKSLAAQCELDAQQCESVYRSVNERCVYQTLHDIHKYMRSYDIYLRSLRDKYTELIDALPHPDWDGKALYEASDLAAQQASCSSSSSSSASTSAAQDDTGDTDTDDIGKSLEVHVEDDIVPKPNQYRVLKQLVVFQQEYVARLKLVQVTIRREFDTNEKLCERVFLEDRPVLFGNVKAMLQDAESFLASITNCVQQWPAIPLGALFTVYLSTSNVWDEYLSGYPHQMNLLLRCSRASKYFATWTSHPAPNDRVYGNESLKALLGSSVLALRKYEHLIEMLNVETPSSDADHANIVWTYSKISSLTNQAITAETQAENLAGLFSLSERLVGSPDNLLNRPSTRLIYEGIVFVDQKSDTRESPAASSTTADNDADESTELYLIVLSDRVIESTPSKRNHIHRDFRKRRYQYERTIQLHMAEFVSLPNSPDAQQNGFQLRISDDQDSVYTYYAKSPGEKAEWVRAFDSALKHLAKTKIFGLPLEKLMNKPEEKHRDVPQLVEMTGNHIIKHGLQAEGIFRLSGSASAVKQFHLAFDLGDDVSALEKTSDVHVVAGVLKLWIRSLPEPLMTYERFDDFIEIAHQLDSVDEEQSVEALRALVEKLPRYNRYVLSYFFSFFSLVSAYEHANKMNNHNLAIVFANHFLSKKGNDMLANVELHGIIFKLFEFLIENNDEVFENVQKERKQLAEQRIAWEQSKKEQQQEQEEQHKKRLQQAQSMMKTNSSSSKKSSRRKKTKKKSSKSSSK